MELISRQEAIKILRESEAYNEDIPNRADGVRDAIIDIMSLPVIFTQSEIIRCKDCKHFEYDHPYIIQGIPILGHEVCNAWGDGCKTNENGYCFMAERKTDE